MILLMLRVDLRKERSLTHDIIDFEYSLTKTEVMITHDIIDVAQPLTKATCSLP